MRPAKQLPWYKAALCTTASNTGRAAVQQARAVGFLKVNSEHSARQLRTRLLVSFDQRALRVEL